MSRQPTLRVLQLITDRQLRGAQVFSVQLAEALSARGRTVAVCSLYRSIGEPALAAESCESLSLDVRRRGAVSWRGVRALSRLLRSWRPDVVQANGSDTLKYSVLARRLGGPTVPIVYRNISFASFWLRGPVHRAWNRWLVRQVDLVAAVTPGSAADFTKTYGLPASRVVTIPIGAPVPPRVEREEGRRRLAEVLGERLVGPVVLHVASLTPEKDQPTLLEAFAEVARRRPDARLVLVGEGPQRPVLVEIVHRLGLRERVILAGSRRDVRGLMPGADVFVLSSLVEGLPGAVLEAAAAALPVVATDVGSVADAVLDGRSGLLVPPGRPKALAEALNRILDDPSHGRELGREGRAQVRRKYDLEVVAGRFDALYVELAGGDR